MVRGAEVTVGISRLHYPVLSLGPGRRIGIWFQGCSIHCPGCMARDTWAEATPAEQMPVARIIAWVDQVTATAEAAGAGVEGVTISGGEPLDQPEAFATLVEWLRRRFPAAGGADGMGVDLLAYTGYRWEQVEHRYNDCVVGVDALVTEPYRSAAGPGGRWRGSANQRLVPLTPLGQLRYAEHVDAPAEGGVQVDVRSGGLHLIGVPRPGEITHIEEALAARGVSLEDCSWST